MSFVDGSLSADGTFTPAGETAAPEPAPAPDPAGAPGEPGGEAAPAAEVPPAADTPEPVAGETPTDYAKRVADWGGPEAIEDAIAIATALRNEEGVRALVEEGLKHLGYDPAAVFNPADPNAEEPDPDRLLTAAELQAELQKRDQAQLTQIQQAQAQRALEAVDQARTSLGITDPDDWDIVRTFAQRYAGPDEVSPEVLQRAVQQGHADYLAAAQKAAQKYVTDRAALNESVPTPLATGGTPGGEELPEPKNMEEARARARAYLRNAGE